MKKRISLFCLFVLVFSYAILEWKYSTKEVSVLVPFAEFKKLSKLDKDSIISKDIYMAFTNLDEYESAQKLDLKPHRLVYWKNTKKNLDSKNLAAAIFVSSYENGSIQLDSKLADFSKNYNIGFAAEIMNHMPISPMTAYGIRLRWIHYMRAKEVDHLSTYKIKQRLKRALVERNIRAIFYNFSGKLSWKAFLSEVLQNYKLSLTPRRVFFNWDRVRLLFTCLFILLLLMECKWFVLVFVGLFFEYPVNIQLCGFLFAQISVFHLYYSYVKGLENKKEVLLFMRIFPLWGKAILFAFTYYFLMDYQDFDQRFFVARGVKISLLLLPACILLYELISNLKSIRTAKKSQYIQGIGFVSLLVFISYVVMVRSGNAPSIEPSQLELALRNSLENIFLARPRFKELIGLFSLVFYFYGLKNKVYIFELLSKLLFGLYLTTFFNSFSHFHTSFWFVLLRELNTIVLGVFPLLFVTLFDLYKYRDRHSTVHLGYFGFHNFGDELLKLSLIQEDKTGKDRYIVNELSSNSNQKKEILRQSYEDIFVCLTNVKNFSLGPGGVLQDRTSSMSLYYYVFYCVVAKLLGARLVWNHLGFSPLTKTINKWIVYIVTKFVDKISVRDDQSFSYLSSLGVSTSKLVLKEDLVYKYNISSSKLEKEDHLAIVLRNWKSAPLKSWIQKIAKSGLRRVYFIFQRDEKLKNMIEKYDQNAIIRVYTAEPQSYYREISRFKKIISMRFHGLILGDIFHSDIFALNYDMKCQSFCEDKKINNFINEKNFADIELFSGKLDKFLKQK